MKYNAVFRLNGTTVTIVGIPHIPQLGAVQRVPGQSRYGHCVAVERDNARACLRRHPDGQLVEFAGY